MDNFYEFLKKINSALWGNYYIFLIVLAFLFLSVKTKFSAFNIFKNTGILKKCFNDKSKRSIVFTSLAASMGTGNIIGTASALKIGGEGSIFWMIIAALLGMSAAYAENYLGCKSKNAPFSYISRMPFGKYFSVLYALSCVFGAIFMGNMIQGNALVSAVSSGFNINKITASLVFSFLIGLVVLGGKERIKNTADKLIPLFSALYIVLCLIGIIINHENILFAVKSIIYKAFDFKAVFGGSVGTAVSVGLRRGTFSNEAGMGSSVLIYGDMDSSPEESGFLASACVFFDTVICCTLTALFIITSKVSFSDNAAGNAFCAVYGKCGEMILSLMISAFAFASIIGWCLYGEISLHYLSCRKSVIKLYRMIQCPVFFLGAMCSIKILWQFADICDFFMLTINLFAVVICFLNKDFKCK